MDSYYTHIILNISISVFALSVLAQMIYYGYFYLPFLLKTSSKKTKIPHSPQAVSIIIAARNEADNLKAFLPTVLEQQYPTFEVIVVNDRSEDNSSKVLDEFKQKYSHLQIIEIKDEGKLKYGKKTAITLGIKAAQYEQLVFTDADCCPVSAFWLQKMAASFTDKSIVLGYGPYFQEASFLNQWIRYDTMTIALQYFSYTFRGRPYMGVGRNLAYKKDLFTSTGGFNSHLDKRSGDDDLFVNAVATKNNTTMVLSPDSFVYSVPEHSFKTWKKQKQRHLTTFSDYQSTHNALLGLEVITRGLFYALFLSLLFTPFRYGALALFGLRMLLFYMVIILSSKRFKEPKLTLYAPFFDISLPLVNLYLVMHKSNN